jgi:preprotein translocase subunit SecD
VGTGAQDEVRLLAGATGKLEFIPLPLARFGTNENPGAESATVGLPLPSPKPPVLFAGDQIASADPAIDSTSGTHVVTFELRSAGAMLFADYTTMHVNEFFAITLDDKVLSAPYIQSPITGGHGQIDLITDTEASRLVAIIRSGSLPAPIREVSFGEGGRFGC